MFTDNIAKIGLYVNGEDTLSINNWFNVVDVILLNGIKHVVPELLLVNATLFVTVFIDYKMCFFIYYYNLVV